MMPTSGQLKVVPVVAPAVKPPNADALLSGGASPPDIVVWSSSTGLYGGLTVDGSVIRAEPNQDSTFYGRPVKSRDVLFGPIDSARAAPLRRELNAIG